MMVEGGLSRQRRFKMPCVLFLFCSSEDTKKHATDAQGNNKGAKLSSVSLVCNVQNLQAFSLCECAQREWVLHTELACVFACFVSANACNTLDGTQYVWSHACAQSLQLSPPDAPQHMPVPSPRLAGLPVALPSPCARPNLGWRIQLVSNLLTEPWCLGLLQKYRDIVLILFSRAILILLETFSKILFDLSGMAVGFFFYPVQGIRASTSFVFFCSTDLVNCIFLIYSCLFPVWLVLTLAVHFSPIEVSWSALLPSFYLKCFCFWHTAAAGGELNNKKEEM